MTPDWEKRAEEIIGDRCTCRQGFAPICRDRLDRRDVAALAAEAYEAGKTVKLSDLERVDAYGAGLDAGAVATAKLAKVYSDEEHAKTYAEAYEAGQRGHYAWQAGEKVGRNEGLEAAAMLAEGGRFLHDDSPEARFGKSMATAIRALKARPKEEK